MAPWNLGQKEIKKLFPITFKNSNGGNKNAHAALYQWNEVPQHPGLVCCMTHTTGVPVVLMIKPGQVLVCTRVHSYLPMPINELINQSTITSIYKPSKSQHNTETYLLHLHQFTMIF
jgi:hypothetical protein